MPLVKTHIELNGIGKNDRNGLGNIYANGSLGWHGERWDAVADAG